MPQRRSGDHLLQLLLLRLPRPLPMRLRRRRRRRWGRRRRRVGRGARAECVRGQTAGPRLGHCGRGASSLCRRRTRAFADDPRVPLDNGPGCAPERALDIGTFSLGRRAGRGIALGMHAPSTALPRRRPRARGDTRAHGYCPGHAYICIRASIHHDVRPQESPEPHGAIRGSGHECRCCQVRGPCAARHSMRLHACSIAVPASRQELAGPRAPSLQGHPFSGTRRMLPGSASCGLGCTCARRMRGRRPAAGGPGPTRARARRPRGHAGPGRVAGRAACAGRSP